MLLLQVEHKAAGEKVSMFRELLRITQTDQVLKRYHLDTPTYLEMSRRGASLLLTLYTDLPVAKSSLSTYATLLPHTYPGTSKTAVDPSVVSKHLFDPIFDLVLK